VTVPYRSQYRNPLRRLAAVKLWSATRVFRRPAVQAVLSAAVILGAVMVLHQRTPEPGKAAEHASIAQFISRG
jgi:hypothetical protein